MKPVYVDCFAWAQAYENADTNMNGIFRHAFALSKEFTPAVILPDDENAPNQGLERLRRILDKPIQVFTAGHELEDQIWLSLGVDQINPAVFPMAAHKMTVLHDAMSGKGVFGDAARRRFFYGATCNDVFLYTSEFARLSFLDTCDQLGIDTSKKTFVTYGCFHHYDELPAPCGLRYDESSLTVHSVYRRKRLERSLMLSQLLRTRHVHCGKLGDVPLDEMQSLVRKYGFRWNYSCNDEMLSYYYSRLQHFICMSQEEGFSMPAMEAIIQGVPHIHLSDISAHKEVYGKYSVNFYDEYSALNSRHHKTVTEEERKQLFKERHFKTIIQNFKDYLNSQF